MGNANVSQKRNKKRKNNNQQTAQPITLHTHPTTHTTLFPPLIFDFDYKSLRIIDWDYETENDFGKNAISSENFGQQFKESIQMVSPNLISPHCNSIYYKQTVFRILVSVFYTFLHSLAGFTGVFIFALISALRQ